MSSIEDKVVKLTFDNKAFEVGIQQTLRSLEALNKGLALTGATKGLTDLGAASKSVSLAHLESGVQGIADKFKAMSIIGITALTTIAHQALVTGGQLVKSLTIDPVKSGLAEYETNLNSIQTILANTGLTGAAGLSKVTDALGILNTYSDQTIFNFSEMARNIGTFTAAGVTLDVATQAIKGIANLAAVSGSSAQQASTAMYQLSQAISAGKVTLEDWNSVVNAGMGGKVFQDSLMETARIHGVAIDKMVKDAGSFRMTLQDGWLTGEILTETLSKFTGDLNAAQLKTMGYNDMQIQGILKMAATAKDAATKIKTMSQLINTLQEAAGSGWAETWALIFGDFDEARDLFTSVNNVLGTFISTSADARNKVIGDWKELGGRTVLIETISFAFRALVSVIKPIKDAFREMFPATTGKQLFDLTVTIHDFVKGLTLSAGVADKLKRTFAGVFAVLGIGWDILKEGVSLLFRLFGVASEGGSSFLNITANIGDFLVAMRKAIKEGDGLEKFFGKIGDILEVPIKIIRMFASAIGSLFDKFNGVDAAKGVTGLVAKFEPLGKLGSALVGAWSKIPDILSNVWKNFMPMASKMADFFANLGKWIADSLGGVNFTALFAGINATAFAAVLLAIRNMISKFSGGLGAGGLFDSITDSFDQLNETLKAMQNTLRAATLLEIAAAVGILAISVVALSKIDSEGLTRALTAITVMFTQLFTAMAIFEKFMGVSDIAELLAMGAGLILLSVAIDILASAVKKLADLDWNGLAKGLTGVSVLLAAVVLTAKFMPNPAGLISTGLGMIVLASAIKLLVSSVTDLSSLSWEDLAKGLIGVGALLAGLTLFTKFAAADKAGLLSGLGIVLLAAGIKILASAVKDFSELSWVEIARGLTGLAGGLALVGAALNLIPPTAPLSAAGVAIVAFALGLISDAVADMADLSWMEIARGLTTMAGALVLISAALILIPPSSLLSAAAVLVVAASLGMIADALKEMASMSWEQIAKSLVLLAGSLTLIVASMILMEAALPGAAALLVVAASLAILAPVLLTFGQMSWEEIGKGLLMLAGVFVVLGLAGLILTPVVPTLIGLGIAVTLLGIGMLAAGVGLLAFSAALTALSIAGVAGTAALVGMVAALAGLIPMVMTQIGLGLVAFAGVIATAGPAMAAAMTTVILAIMDAIDKTAPKVIATMLKLLEMLLTKMADATPQMVEAGYKILIGFLTGIKNNITRVVTIALEIIAAYLDGIAKGLPRITQSGVNLIITFINSMADAIRSNSSRMNDAGWNLASAIVEGMVKGIFSGQGRIASAARDAAKKALDAAKDFLGINSPSKEFEKIGMGTDEGFALGINKFSHLVTRATEDVGAQALSTLKDSLSNMANIVTDDINLDPVIRPVLDLTDIKKNAGEIGTILGATPLIIKDTVTTAHNISGQFQANANDGTDPTSGGHSESFTFNQYNTSPKALTSAEIYRNTNNQLSRAKKAVAP